MPTMLDIHHFLVHDDFFFYHFGSFYQTTTIVALSFVTGLVLLMCAAFNGGYYLEQFLSGTVLSGFTQGAALLICISQTKHLLAISIVRSFLMMIIPLLTFALGIPPDADNAQKVLIGLWEGREAFNYVTLIIGV